MPVGTVEIDLDEIGMARQVITTCLAESWRRTNPSQPGNPQIVFPLETIRCAGQLLFEPISDTTGSGCFLDQSTFDDLESLVNWLSLDSSRREQANLEVFGLVIPKDYPPYETEYLPWNDPTHRAHHLADISGFYRAFGLEPNPECPERHDHISIELDFTAFLLAKGLNLAHSDDLLDPERLEVNQRALVTFLRDHLLWWIPIFASRVDKRTRLGASESNLQEAINWLGGVARLTETWARQLRESYSLQTVGPPSLKDNRNLTVRQEIDEDEIDGMTCG